MIGRLNNERIYKYVPAQYIKAPDNLENIKLFLPKANGSGAIGEVLSTLLPGYPTHGSHTNIYFDRKF